jgi:hypothetical protein
VAPWKSPEHPTAGREIIVDAVSRCSDLCILYQHVIIEGRTWYVAGSSHDTRLRNVCFTGGGAECFQGPLEQYSRVWTSRAGVSVAICMIE